MTDDEMIPKLAYSPPIPYQDEQLGISKSLITDLVLRRVYSEGTSNLTSLMEVLKLPHPIIEGVFHHLRQQQLLEVRGMVGEDYTFVLSEAGRQFAIDRLQISQYASAAPVSINHYVKAARAQVAVLALKRPRLRSALADIVVTEEMLDQLGPAVVSQKALFLYGSTGNGKTSIAERLVRVYDDLIVIPYAVEVDGQIIMLYDPVVHQRVDYDTSEMDARWVVCRRPCVIVGGELISSMLELQLDVASNIYAAPVQMKANNGMLIIDDFGRQVMAPRELLNRWIIPLDRRVDYLTLRHGVKFQIPFELMVIFATNLEPTELADEAFLRRIHNKIHVHAVDAQVFDTIFQRVVEAAGITCDEDSAEYLRGLCFRSGATELRACYPRDIRDISTWISRFEERPVRMTKEDMERAAKLYFTQTKAVSPPSEV